MPQDTPPTDSAHIVRAITTLGEKQPVLTVKPLFNNQGLKVLDKGVAVQAQLYERLMQHQLAEPLEDAVSPAHGVNGHGLQAAALTLLSESPLLAQLYQDTALKSVVLDLIDKMPLPPAVALQLPLARELHPDLYRHLLQTALLNAWLVHAPLVSRYDLGSAVAAGLLHDLGMLHLNPALLGVQTPLTPELERQLASHPMLSHALIERHHVYPNEVLRAVLEHHECADGSGYPRRLTGTQTSPLGQALGLAQTLSAIAHPQRANPALQLSVLLRMNPQRYAPTLAGKVLAALRPMLHAPTPMDTPETGFLGALESVHTALENYPTAAPPSPWSEKLEDQVAHMRRCLAEAGVTPTQLQLLDRTLEPTLQQELQWLAREAVWQLRALARQAQLAWHGNAAMSPDHQIWFEQVHHLGRLWLTPEAST